MGDRLKELEIWLNHRVCVGKARNIFYFAALRRKHLPGFEPVIFEQCVKRL